MSENFCAKPWRLREFIEHSRIKKKIWGVGPSMFEGKPHDMKHTRKKKK